MQDVEGLRRRCGSIRLEVQQDRQVELLIHVHERLGRKCSRVGGECLLLGSSLRIDRLGALDERDRHRTDHGALTPRGSFSRGQDVGGVQLGGSRLLALG